MNYTQILKHTPYIFLITLALIVFITVAYNSSGYHHEDEHYQLIEFANYKLGLLEKRPVSVGISFRNSTRFTTFDLLYNI